MGMFLLTRCLFSKLFRLKLLLCQLFLVDLLFSEADDGYYNKSDAIFWSNLSINNNSENSTDDEVDIIPSTTNIGLELCWPNATVPFLFHNKLGKLLYLFLIYDTKKDTLSTLG